MSALPVELQPPAAESPQYLEDFVAGQTYRSDRVRITAADIKAFAAQFDPQPFHLDDAAASNSVFGRLAASGWHTAALTMRLLTGSAFNPAGGIVGAGLDELRWPNPVRPGDELWVENQILEVRTSKSRPTHGLMKARATTFNQHGEPVQVMVTNLLVQRQPAGNSQ